MGPRTLVVHTGGIGDFLLALPALERIARGGPLELAGRRERLQLAVDAGIAKAVHDLDRIAFYSILSEPSPVLTAFLRQFQRVIVWMRDDGGLIARNVQACGVEDVNVYPGLPPERWERHAAEYYAQCLGVEDNPAWRLRIAPGMDTQPDLGDALVIHPGSGGRRKNWPLDSFEEVAGRIGSDFSNVWWSLGPAEEEINVPSAARRLPPCSLADLARVLAGAAIYLGNDSGISHLAAAVGCPSIAVFGPTDPKVWAPRGAGVRVVRGDPWPAIEAVVDAVRAVRAVR